jgi:hypothetical protein
LFNVYLTRIRKIIKTIKTRKMKKLVMVFALGAILGSCGDSAAEIDVKSLDTPCACTEAAISVMDEMIDLKEKANGMQDASEEDQKAVMGEFEILQGKMKEIETKCVGDLAADKAGEDCEALKELPKKMEEYQKAM